MSGLESTGFDGLTWDEAREVLARCLVVVNRVDRGPSYYELHARPVIAADKVPEVMKGDACYRLLPPWLPEETELRAVPEMMGWCFSPVFERVSSTVGTYPGPRQGIGKVWLELKRCGFMFAPYVELDDRNSSLDGT